MIKKLTGMILVLGAVVVIWLFPALATPRQGRPFDGQDPLQFHQTEMVKVERSQRITLWVCVTAGVILGVGLSLIVSGKRKPEQTEQRQPG